MEIGTHHYGRDEDPFRDNPVIALVKDELVFRGAHDRDGARSILPDVEDDLGTLTDRERDAVLRRFDS